MQFDGNALVLALIAALATPIVTGVGALIVRSWTRSDARRAELMTYYKEQLEDAREDRDKAEAAREVWERRASRWHEQLLANGITPDPRWGDPV